MNLPPDWDEPSRDNKDLCNKFSYETFDYSGMLPYRLFVPDSSDKVPLVVFFHGADAFGKDNELQLTMHDIGITFARDEWQRQHADLLIIGGTSLEVGSAAQLAHMYHGKYLVIINKGKTKMEGKADLVFHDSIGKVLSTLEL